MQSSMQSGTPKGLNEISVYSGETAGRDIIKSETKKLIAAFPEVTSDFIILLGDRLSENQFTAQRVRDAINHIVDTNPYKRPSIAEIISFDRKVKLFKYEEIQAKCAPGYSAFDHFERITIEGRPRWIEK